MNNNQALFVGLAGATAINALAVVVAVRAATKAANQRGDQYVKGVRETVDRLAQSLPPQPSDS